MSNRTPATHQVMMYGAPPVPGPWPGDQPWIPPTVPQIPFEPYPVLPDTTTGTKIVLPAAPQEKRHVRVVTRKETDGTLKLKVYIDGELQTEVESDGTTLNAEFDL